MIAPALPAAPTDPLPSSVALKEWAVVCHELLAGRQIVLVRKGGLHEPHRGAFTAAHDAFFLYPNAEHQSAEQLKPQVHPLLSLPDPPAAERGAVVLPAYCRVVDVVEVRDAARLRALEPLTCWSQALFDMRLRYKPECPNYALTLRCFRLTPPATVPYDKTYAGCRSWVPLRQPVEPAAPAPVLSDAAFAAARASVREALRVC